jgi:SAM-dependent methyltransferase
MDYIDYQNNNSTELHFWFKAKNNLIHKLLNSVLGGNNNKILDIGCGTGTELEILSKFGKVTALDTNENAVNLTRELGYDTIHADIQNYAFTEQYDCICCFDILEHIEQDEQVLMNIYKALKPGGFFVFTVPAHQWLFSPHDKYLDHKRRYSKKDIKEKLIKANFSIKTISFWNSLLFPLVAIIRLIKILLMKLSIIENFSSESQTPNKYINHFLFLLLDQEKKIALTLLSAPTGLSIYGIVKK